MWVIILIVFVLVIGSILFYKSKSKKLLEAPVRTEFPRNRILYQLVAETGVNYDTVKFVRIGHATNLVTIGNKTILTDPWFSEKMGYYHGEPLAFALDRLPSLSMVIISHEHYDHFDMETFKAYPDKNVPFVVTVGLGARIKAVGFNRVYEMDPWQTVTIDEITVTACPAKHGVKENTFMIQAGKRVVYFGGDTELIPELKEIKKRFPPIDLAILSINGLMIRPMFNKQVVMNAKEAAQLCKILHPKIAVPIHYNFTGGKFNDTFFLKYNGTTSEFVENVAEKAPDTKTFVLETGDILSIV